jgi:hypothetical protein
VSGDHVFVDESKRQSYVMVAVGLGSAQVGSARAVVRGLRAAGTRRVHFQSENDMARRRFLDRVALMHLEHGMWVRVYVTSGRKELENRRAILTRMVDDLVEARADRLVLERDDSTVVHDEQAIKRARADTRAIGSLRYDHLRSSEEPMLWVPDAIAWAWCRDRAWRALVAPMLSEIIEL